MEVCRAVSNNNAAVTKAPDDLKIVRASVLKYLFNAVYFNVHYKDLALSNIEHMTNFFMYPIIEEDNTATPRVYPFYKKLFANTSTVNRGYLTHCFTAVIDAGLTNNPFITRRDFDLMLLHKVLTGELKLSLTLCRSYLFKGSYNPLAEVHKCFVMALRMASEIPPTVCQWVKVAGAYVMCAAEAGMTKRALKIGLSFCADNVLYWTPSKIASIMEFARTTDVRVSTEKIPSTSLMTVTKGVFLITTSQGLIVNTRDCHPYVYAWTPLGVYRYDNMTEYLYSELGAAVNATVRQVKCTSN